MPFPQFHEMPLHFAICLFIFAPFLTITHKSRLAPSHGNRCPEPLWRGSSDRSWWRLASVRAGLPFGLGPGADPGVYFCMCPRLKISECVAGIRSAGRDRLQALGGLQKDCLMHIGVVPAESPPKAEP
uniref:Uncharacterized protein n=1 Tax=Molossus molossus TaxID=27622 RepID=A0A7J8JXA1_MOLMO|nr:hypothetical protein HJG59_008081 [Molossus molossus]